MAQGRLARVTPYMHGHLCVVWWLSSSPVSFFFSFLLLFFQTFQTPFSAFHKKFMSKDLRDFRLGTVVSNDHETPLTQGSSLVCVRVISIHGHRHAHLFLSVVFFLVSLYFVLKSFFHFFLNPAMVPDENSMEDPLCNSSFGSMVTLDYVTPDTGFEPKVMELADTNERNLATSSDIYFQNTLEDTASFPNADIDDDELAEFLAVVVDRTVKPVEVRSNSDQFSCDIRNLKSAQSQFPLVTQPKRMINQTGGFAEERIAEEL